MVERDEAILRAVAERLEGTHYTVEMIHEELFCFNRNCRFHRFWHHLEKVAVQKSLRKFPE